MRTAPRSGRSTSSPAPSQTSGACGADALHPDLAAGLQFGSPVAEPPLRVVGVCFKPVFPVYRLAGRRSRSSTLHPRTTNLLTWSIWSCSSSSLSVAWAILLTVFRFGVVRCIEYESGRRLPRSVLATGCKSSGGEQAGRGGRSLLPGTPFSTVPQLLFPVPQVKACRARNLQSFSPGKLPRRRIFYEDDLP